MSQRSAWIVDDESSMRFIMREALLRDDFSVQECSSGAELIRACKQAGADEFPDVMLIDVKMPGMDGFQVCQYVRSLPQGRDIPILMVTGLDDAESINQAFECGATDFITKPVNWSTFQHHLRFVLRATDAMHDVNRYAERLERAEKVAKLGHLDWNIQHKTMSASLQVFKIFDIDPQSPEVFHQTLHQAIHRSDRPHVDLEMNRSISMGVDLNVSFRICLPDGSQRHVQLQGEVQHNAMGVVSDIFTTLHDITDLKRHEAMISQMAYYDDVTGIPNRTLFKEHLKLALHQAERADTQLAVMFIDLDKFKRINDTLGHHAGDELLKTVAERLSGVVRSSDVASRMIRNSATVARLGGDEFTILLNDLECIDDISIVVGRIQQALKQPMMIEGQKVFVTISMGIAIYPDDGSNPSMLLKHADTAMYHSKQHGRNCCFLYKDISQPINKDELQLENELHNALACNELELYYQPKLELENNRLIGFEALLRWMHPDKGMIPPNDFIPLAESCGLMVPIGEWVLRQACQQINQWSKQGFRDITVAINFSGQQFNTPDLTMVVRDILAEYAVDPACIDIELTESMLMQDVDAATTTLYHLKDLGVHLSIDDFGTGYSSMSYLKSFPMHTLKIDRSFIQDICHSGKDASITKSIIVLARNLDMNVIAEGVETDEQLNLLRQFECHQIQGYIFARPMPVQEASAFLLQHRQQYADHGIIDHA